MAVVVCLMGENVTRDFAGAVGAAVGRLGEGLCQRRLAGAFSARLAGRHG